MTLLKSIVRSSLSLLKAIAFLGEKVRSRSLQIIAKLVVNSEIKYSKLILKI